MSSYLYGSYITDNTKDNKLVVESINSICESTVCSIKPLDEEYVVVNEIYFSKKDLQDPETFKKLLKRAEVEKDVKKKLDILFYCLTFIEAIVGTKGLDKVADKIGAGNAIGGGLSFGQGLATFIALLILFIKLTDKIVGGLDKAMLYIHKARINKLIKKATELRDKTKQSNPKVSANCQKLLDSIEKYYKDIEEAKFRREVEYAKGQYNFLVDILHGKDCFESTSDAIDVYVLARLIKVDYSKIDSNIIQYGINHKKKAINKEFYWIYDDSDKSSLDKLYQKMPEFETKDDIIVFDQDNDSDYVFIYSEKGKVFFDGELCNVKDDDFKRSPSEYQYIKREMAKRFNDKNFIEALKVADAELGYYRLTPAPEGETVKKI